MKLPNIKNIRDISKVFSYQSVVYISLWTIVFLALAGLLLDIWIFYAYGYKIVNTTVVSDYAITLKRKDLTDIIDTLNERKEKLANLFFKI